MKQSFLGFAFATGYLLAAQPGMAQMTEKKCRSDLKSALDSSQVAAGNPERAGANFFISSNYSGALQALNNSNYRVQLGTYEFLQKEENIAFVVRRLHDPSCEEYARSALKSLPHLPDLNCVQHGGSAC
jgi:hypothetical protein